MRTETVRARVSPDLKHDVEGVLGELGLSMSEAIVMFMSQIRLHHGMPFDVKIPNKMTQRTLNDADNGKDVHQAKNLDDLFQQLGLKDA